METLADAGLNTEKDTPVRRTLIILIPAVLGLAALSGCGSDGDAQAESSATAEPTATAAPTSTPPVSDAPRTVPAPAETAPPVTEAPVTEPPVATEPSAPVTYAVAAVVDGDTLDLVASDGGAFRVRLIGIDAPESGACEGPAATDAMVRMVQGRTVTLSMGGDGEDTDTYGRFLRYVDVDGVDTGRAMIEVGLATARYDSRDGYGRHDREDTYVAADAASADFTCQPAPTAPPAPAPAPAPAPTPQPQPQPEPGNVRYANCDDVRAHGADPIHPGDPGWQQKFDRDSDGVGCE